MGQGGVLENRTRNDEPLGAPFARDVADAGTPGVRRTAWAVRLAAQQNRLGARQITEDRTQEIALSGIGNAGDPKHFTSVHVEGNRLAIPDGNVPGGQNSFIAR